MIGPRMVRRLVNFDRDDWVKLQEIAKRHRMTASQLIREAVQQVIQDAGKKDFRLLLTPRE